MNSSSCTANIRIGSTLAAIAALVFTIDVLVASAAQLIVNGGGLQVFNLPFEAPSAEDPCTGDTPQPSTAYVDDDYGSAVVPPRFKTIKAAVKWAHEGFTIRVCAGEYRENVEIKKVGLRIIGDGAEVTIVKSKEHDKDVFEIEGADGIEIAGLTVTKGDEGIDAKDSRGHSFYDNLLVDNEKGIELDETLDSQIFHNSFAGNDIGIFLTEADGNTIETNLLSGSDYGIYVGKSDENTLTGNQISGFTKGIYLFKADDTDVKGNSITENGFGIFLRLKSGMQATIEANVLQDNEYGIEQVKESGQVGEVRVVQNDFIDNDHQVAGDRLSAVQWDYGYDCSLEDGGNYWSDVTGTDTHGGPGQDKDGPDDILDDPVMLAHDAVDHYPFASLGGWSGGYTGVKCGAGDPIVYLQAEPQTLPADGVSFSTITAYVTDETDTPVPDGTMVTFTTPLGTFMGGGTEIEATTLGSQVVGVLTAGGEPGVAIVTAAVGVDSGQIEVEFIKVEEDPPEPGPQSTELTPIPTETPTEEGDLVTPTPSETPAPEATDEVSPSSTLVTPSPEPTEEVSPTIAEGTLTPVPPGWPIAGDIGRATPLCVAPSELVGQHSLTVSSPPPSSRTTLHQSQV